jgi:hypothetical protein
MQLMTVSTRILFLLPIAHALGCGIESCPPTTQEIDGKCIRMPASEASSVAPVSSDADAGSSTGRGGGSCARDEDCDSEATCDDELACQGTRAKRTCVNNACKTSTYLDDDSACGAETIARECGLFKPVTCNGESDQLEPECPVACGDDSDCDPTANCHEGSCVALGTRADGETCETSSECRTRHCANGFCCAAGDCCAKPSQCPAEYQGAAKCDEIDKCQGSREEAACERSMCSTSTVEDDSACNATIVARTCSGTPNVVCTGGKVQQEPPACADPPTSMPAPKPSSSPAPEPSTPSAPRRECTSDQQCPAIKTCTDARACDGTRQDRHCDLDRGTCQNLGMPVKDDSACVGKPTGLDCGSNVPLGCTAAVDQPTPTIANGCEPCTATPECTVPGELPINSTDEGAPCRAYLPCAPGEMQTTGNCGWLIGSGVVHQKAVGCAAGATTCTAGKCSP